MGRDSRARNIETTLNLSSLSAVADFAAKADFFSLNLLMAAAVFLAMALWLRPSVARVFDRRDVVFVWCLLAVPYIVVAGAFRLNKVSVALTTVIVFAVGMIERRSARAAGAAAPRSTEALSDRERWMTRAAVAALVAVALFNIVDDRLWVHYDYFSQSIVAIDLGLNGRSPSTWLQTFDPGRWFVVSQGIMPVLDAYEVFLNGTITTTLSQLLLLMLMVLVVRAAPRRALDLVVLVAVLGIYLIDYNRAPRPHVFVGIIAGLFLLRAAAAARWTELSVYLALLALAKRDGLVLAVLIASVELAVYVRRRFGWRVVIALVTAMTIALALLLNSWVALWQRTPLEAIIFALSRASYWQLIQRPEVAQSVVAGLLVIGVMKFSGVAGRVLAVPVIFSLFVAASAVTVDGMANYNFGTILRKLFYLQCPVLLCGLLAARVERVPEPVHETGEARSA